MEKCNIQQLQTYHTLPKTCGMSKVSYHLRKAKLAWMIAYGSGETKQTCIRDSLR